MTPKPVGRKDKSTFGAPFTMLKDVCCLSSLSFSTLFLRCILRELSRHSFFDSFSFMKYKSVHVLVQQLT